MIAIWGKMRKVELLPTQDCEAGYGPALRPLLWWENKYHSSPYFSVWHGWNLFSLHISINKTTISINLICTTANMYLASLLFSKNAGPYFHPSFWKSHLILTRFILWEATYIIFCTFKGALDNIDNFLFDWISLIM